MRGQGVFENERRRAGNQVRQRKQKRDDVQESFHARRQHALRISKLLNPSSALPRPALPLPASNDTTPVRRLPVPSPHTLAAFPSIPHNSFGVQLHSRVRRSLFTRHPRSLHAASQPREAQPFYAAAGFGL